MSWRITAGYIHPEARNWSDRVASNSGTVSSSTLTAVSNFCVAVDAEAGLRAAITRLNLFCGDNLNAALVPLYLAESFGAAAKGNTTDTNVSSNFVSGDYALTGATGGLSGGGSGGTAKYLDTGLPHNQVGSSATGHLSFSGNNLPITEAIPLGAYNGATGNLEDINLNPAVNATTYRFGAFSSSGTAVSSTRTHLIGTRNAGVSKIYVNGLAAAVTPSSGTLTRSTRTYYIFALNISGSAAGFMSGRLRMYSIGDGLTASQAAAFSTAVANFNTALGRT